MGAEVNEYKNARVADKHRSSLIGDYLGYLKVKKSRSELTLDSYESDLSQLVAFLAESGGDSFCDADRHILNVDTQLACRFVEFLKRQYTTSTLSRKITAVRRFYCYLFAQQKLHENPFLNIAIQPIPSASLEYLEEEHIQQLFDAISGTDWLASRDRAIVAVLCCTGMRVSELLSLTAGDIDLDSAAVQIHTVAGTTRTGVLPPWALHAVERYIQRRRTKVSENPMPKDVLFVNCDGGPLTSRSVRRKLAEYSRRANLTIEATPAVLRHSCAIHALRRGADIKAVRRQLGHLSSSSMRPYLDCLYGGRTQPAPLPETIEIAIS